MTNRPDSHEERIQAHMKRIHSEMAALRELGVSPDQIASDVADELLTDAERRAVHRERANAVRSLAQAAQARLDQEREEAQRERFKATDLPHRMFLGRVAGAMKGQHQSGPAPYGYRRGEDKRLVVDQVEAPVVVMMFNEYLRRRSMKKLQVLLAERGIRTRRGHAWSRAGVAWILRNETYRGTVKFGDVRTTGTHEPIISPIIFNKVQQLVEKNDRRRERRTAKVCEHGKKQYHCQPCKNAALKKWRAAIREARGGAPTEPSEQAPESDSREAS